MEEGLMGKGIFSSLRKQNWFGLQNRQDQVFAGEKKFNVLYVYDVI